MLGITLLVGLLCGVIGVLVDLDHIVAIKYKHSGRIFHTYLLCTSIVVLGGLISYLGGFLA